MHTAAALRAIHERTHQSLQGLLDHCAGFSTGQLAQELDGFGYPSIRQQLHHMVGAEAYWVGVINGLMLVDEYEEDFASIEALRAFRARVSDVTAAYLDSATDEDVNRVRTTTTYGDKSVDLAPANVILRTQMHIFQHQGQIAAMARLLGRPIPTGLDFPVR